MAGQVPTKGAPGQRTSRARKTTGPRKAPAKKAPAKKAPGKVVAKLDKDKLPTDLTLAKAKALTGKIKTGLATNWQLMAQAAEGRAWKALGYTNWGAWMDKEFGDLPALVMSKDKRKEAVKELDAKGFSVRAQSDILRTSKSQIDRDIQEIRGLLNEPPAPPEPPVPPAPSVPLGTDGDGDKADNIEDAEEVPLTDTGDSAPPEPPAPEPPAPPSPTISRDNRQRDTSGISAAAKARKDTEVIKVAKGIAADLEKIRERLGKLLDRDDYNGDIDTIKAVDEILRQPIGDLFDEVREFMPEPEPAGA